MPDRVERTGIQPVRERVVDRKRGHQKQPGVAHVFQPVTLQRPQVVCVAKLAAQLFENRPVPVPARGPELTREVIAEVLFHAVVIEQRVVTVEQEDDVVRRGHFVLPSGAGLCQPSDSATSASACLGPQLPRLYGRARACFLSTGSTTAHAASTASSRVKRAPSPAIASVRSRSYGVSSPG